MEDVKLRPVGTLACHVRRTRASSQANIYRVASRPFARDSGACKKEFHSRNEVKIVRLRFLYINDSPPLDWHHPTFVSTGNERWIFSFSPRFFFFSQRTNGSRNIRKFEELFSNIRETYEKLFGGWWNIWYVGTLLNRVSMLKLFFYKLMIFDTRKNGFRTDFSFFFLPRNIEVELCEFYSVFQFFFVEMLQLINIGTF